MQRRRPHVARRARARFGLWLQLVLTAYDGVWPGTLWANFETHSGPELLFAQLGSGPLLVLPLVAVLAFVYVERSYLQIVLYDFTSQLEPQHRIVAECVRARLFAEGAPCAGFLQALEKACHSRLKLGAHVW